MKQPKVSSRADVRAWIEQNRPEWIDMGAADVFEGAICDWQDRPAWGDDWSGFWDVNVLEVEAYAFDLWAVSL